MKHYVDKMPGAPGVNQAWLNESYDLLEVKPQAKDFNDLTLYEYSELLLHKSRWDLYRTRLSLNLGSEAFRRLLQGVRETWNTLAHFRGDVTARQREQLRFCADWLARHQVPVGLNDQAGKATAEMPAANAEPATTFTEPSTSADSQDVRPTDEALQPTDSRYAPLALALRAIPPRQDSVQWGFDQIEGAINSPLPPSARQHRAWWANDSVGHVQSQQWLDVDWRVSQINLSDERVTFTRIREREKAYIRFFSQLEAKLRALEGFRLKEMSPDGQSWFTVAVLPERGPQILYFFASFARQCSLPNRTVHRHA